MFRKLANIITPSKPDPMPPPLILSQALQYVQSLPVEGSSTPVWYATAINLLVKICDGDIPINQLTADHIRQWQVYVESEKSTTTGKRLSVWTQDSYKRALRSWLNHLTEAGHLPQQNNLTKVLRFKRLPEPEPKYLADDQMATLLQKSQRTPRDHAMMHVLRASGVRLGGLLSMQTSTLEIYEVQRNLTPDQQELIQHANQLRLLDHIRRDTIYEFRGSFWVNEKGSDRKQNHRKARLDHQACQALNDYLAIRPVNAPDNLWLTHDGKPITARAMYDAFKVIANTASIDCSPHDIRHTFCRKLLESGIDLNIATKLSGHQDPLVLIRIYGAARPERVDEIYYERMARN